MKRATAITHLVEMAEAATEGLSWRGNEHQDWAPKELWVAGELLEDVPALDAVSVVVVLDLPAEELPWQAPHARGRHVEQRLGLGKRPVLWTTRPASWPAWTPWHLKVVRYWSDSDGLDEPVIEALRARQLDRLDVVEPDESERSTQFTVELAASRRHLRAVLDGWWERKWQQANRDFGMPLGDVLWRAASAVSELQDALDPPEVR